MVGKPNFPSDVEDREEIQGAAAPTRGLSALDQQREASLADEGGWAGAVMESQAADEAGELRPHRSIPSRGRPGLGLLAAAFGAFAAVLLIRRMRS